MMVFTAGLHFDLVSYNTMGVLTQCTVLCFPLFRIQSYCAVLCCAVLYCAVLYCTVLYCTVLYCTVLYCTVLYCTVLYCTVLYCTVLDSLCVFAASCIRMSEHMCCQMCVLSGVEEEEVKVEDDYVIVCSLTCTSPRVTGSHTQGRPSLHLHCSLPLL